MAVVVAMVVCYGYGLVVRCLIFFFPVGLVAMVVVVAMVWWYSV